MNGPLVALLVTAAGGLGAVARFVLDGLIRERVRTPTPPGTFVINLSGSLLLGLITGLVLAGAPLDLKLIAGTGFLGGYTTFSTAVVDTARLLSERRWSVAAINGLGMLVLSVALAAAGLALGLVI